MPEGPIVKAITEALDILLKNKKLKDIKVLGGRYRRHGLPELSSIKKDLPLKIISVRSKGKFIYFTLSKGWYIWNTLGLNGWWTTEEKKHNNVLLKTDKNFFYNDSRNFGTIKFSNSKDDLQRKLDSLGPDMLGKTDVKVFIKRLRKKENKSLAVVLMDQKVISGIGNYLRAEILYECKYNPHKLIKERTDRELRRLYKCAQKIIQKSYNIQKVNIKNYFNITHREYKSNYIFKVYSHKEDPKGNKVKREDVNKRTLHWVPKVQTL
jgi:DNA-formamidopyrimidine glycosylase